MTNSNSLIFITVLAIIVFLSIVWKTFYMNYLNKIGFDIQKRSGTKNDFNGRSRLLSTIKPDLSCSKSICPIGLPNTDDDIIDALEYIKPANYAGNLLRNIYEQTGI